MGYGPCHVDSNDPSYKQRISFSSTDPAPTQAQVRDPFDRCILVQTAQASNVTESVAVLSWGWVGWGTNTVGTRSRNVISRTLK